jgi:hypothetical protein
MSDWPLSRSDETYPVDVCPLLLREPKLLDSNLNSLISTTVYVGKAPTMWGVTDGTDVHTVNEQGCREDMCVGGKRDQEVKSMAIHGVVELKSIQCLRCDECNRSIGVLTDWIAFTRAWAFTSSSLSKTSLQASSRHASGSNDMKAVGWWCFALRTNASTHADARRQPSLGSLASGRRFGILLAMSSNVDIDHVKKVV